MNSGRKLFVLSLVIVFILLAVNVFGASYNCHNCTNCTQTIFNANNGDIINLTSNINYSGTTYCINVSRPITIDCKNYAIQGNNIGNGFNITKKNNVYIKNCDIRNFTRGILYVGDIAGAFNTNFSILNSNIYDNTVGLYSKEVTNFTFTNNNVYDNYQGIRFNHDDRNYISFKKTSIPVIIPYDNIIENNSFYNNDYGIWGNDSYYYEVNKNNFTLNNRSIFLNNSGEWFFNNNNIINNSYGMEIYYSGMMIFLGPFFPGVSLNIQILDNNISYNDYGIFANNTMNLFIDNNNISYNNKDGMYTDSGSINNNYMCFNNQSNLLFYDINWYPWGFGGAGTSNTCQYSNNWADNGMALGCTYPCIPIPCLVNHTNPILNSTFGTSLSSENLTLYNQSSVNVLKNIVSWNKNGTPIQTVNLPLELPGTTAKDYSGNGNNANIVGGTYINGSAYPGHDGFGFFILGAGGGFALSYINISSNVDFNNSDFTISIWDLNITPSGTSFIFSKGGVSFFGGPVIPGYFMVENFDGSVTMFLTDQLNNTVNITGGNVTSSGPLGIGWNNFVVTVNRTGNMSLYQNGILIGTKNITGIGNISNNQSLLIGSDYSGLLLNTAGIDDITIYDYVLTPQQISQNVLTNNVIHSSSTKNGEVWQGCITPTDLICEGPKLCSNNLVIGGGPGPISPYCNNCSECNNLLKTYNGSGNTTYLNTSLNINGTCINATGIVNLTFDCQNNIITGNGTGYGVLLDNAYNFTLQNCEINNFTTSILDINGNLNNLFSNTMQYSNLGLGVGSINILAMQNNIDYNDEGVSIIGNGAILDSNNIRYNNQDGVNTSGNNFLANTNYICFNNQNNINYYDIDNVSAGGSGDNNTCQLFNNWQDTSATSGCVNLCVTPSPVPRKTSSGGGGGSYTSLKMFVDVKGGYAGDYVYVDSYNYYNNALFDAKISVYKDGELITSTHTDVEGSGYFKVNEPGIYEIKITKAGYSPTIVSLNLEKKPVREAPKILQESTPEIIPEIKEIVEPVFEEIKESKQEKEIKFESEKKSEVNIEPKKVKSVLFPIIIFSLLIFLVLGVAIYEIVKPPAKKITDKINDRLKSVDKLLRKIK